MRNTLKCSRSCQEVVGSQWQKEFFHTINKLDEDMNLVFIISSSHFCSTQYFNDTLQCKTRNPYSDFINPSMYPILYLSHFPFKGHAISKHQEQCIYSTACVSNRVGQKLKLISPRARLTSSLQAILLLPLFLDAQDPLCYTDYKGLENPAPLYLCGMG